jgi:hypothetical protein
MELSTDQIRNLRIFFPYATQKTLAAATNQQRFVHYSSAEAAMAMIRNRQVWMRKSSCMNDFMEVEHGFDCLSSAYHSAEGKHLLKILDQMFDGLAKAVTETFDGWLPQFRNGTWLTCMSEHLPEEDEHGRLSMWRAYGGVAGVAIVMNGKPFISPTDALKAYTSPVAYFDIDAFQNHFSEIVFNIQENMDYLKIQGRQFLLNNVFSAFRYAVHCTKHPGFHEEREWRILHTPRFEPSDRLDRSIEVIKGIPQPVYKIKLQDIPDEGLRGIEPPELIDRIIIGPSDHPSALYDAFVDLLGEAGVPDASSRVHRSGIPLRQ